MSLNFSQFPTPRLPIQSNDFVVGYQFVGAGLVPTLAQYTMLQLAGIIGTLIPSEPPSGPAGGDLSGTYPNPTVTSLHVTSGSISGVTITNGTIAGTTGVTQPTTDNSTLLATDQFVNQQIIRSTETVPITLTGGVYNQATLGTGFSPVVFATGGVVTSILTIANPGSGYAVGDLITLAGGNDDATLRVATISGSGVASVTVLYGGTGYTTGVQLMGTPIPPGDRNVVFTGVLTSNVTFIIAAGTFNTASRRPSFANNTTGAFTVTVFLSNGADGTVGVGYALPQGTANSTSVLLQTDGETDVWPVDTPRGIGALPTTGGTVSGNLAVTGTLTPSQTNGIVGTTTNNNANAGSVGEFISSTSGAVSLTTATAANITSISLTAGDWDVWGNVAFASSANNMAAIRAWTSTASATPPTQPNNGGDMLLSFATGLMGGGTEITAGLQRFSLSATTTVFLSASATFAAGTASGTGFIGARRRR